MKNINQNTGITGKIRLTQGQISAIQTLFKKFFKETDKLWLFGSRVDLNKKGGDIDLYIETTKTIDEISEARNKFYQALMMDQGEQKIDIVIKFDATDLPIYLVAKESGVRLV